MRFPSRLKFRIAQINGLRSFIEKTKEKSEYRRVVAVLQQADGKTYDCIAREHRVHIRTTKKWIDDYIKKEIEGLKIRKNHGGELPPILSGFFCHHCVPVYASKSS